MIALAHKAWIALDKYWKVVWAVSVLLNIALFVWKVT